MHPLKRVMLCLGLLPLWLSQAAAADQVIVFPASTTNLLTVLRASDLSQQGMIAAPSSSFQVVQAIDGKKRYLLNRQASQSITVFSSQTLQILSTPDLGTSASQAVVTPDGRYLLVAAGTLRVIDTQTDTEIRRLQVGGAPTEIIVDNASTTAYVLAAQGRTVSRIDLETLTVSATVDVVNAGSIALTCRFTSSFLPILTSVLKLSVQFENNRTEYASSFSLMLYRLVCNAAVSGKSSKMTSPSARW